MTQKFSVKVVGILFKPSERKILVGKNLNDKNFSFVEGELNYDEELDIGLKRITKEKTGYKIHNLGSIYAKNKIPGKKDLLELYFLCEATEGKEKPGKNVQELKWIKPKQVEKILNQKLPTRLREYIFGLE